MNPKHSIFIHLIVIGALGLWTPVGAQNADSGAQNDVLESNFTDVGPWKIDSKVSVQLNLRDGVSIEGFVSSYSLNGLLGDFGHIHWDTLAPSDRLRTFRTLLRKSGREDHVGLRDLVVVMLATGETPQSAQSLNRWVSRVEKGNRERMEFEVREQARQLRASWDLQKTIQNAEQLQRGAFVVRYVQDRGSHAWTPPIPAEQPLLAEQVRTRITTLISGLDLKPAQGRSIIVFGANETIELARTAVELDRLHEKLSEMLGLVDDANSFSGVAAMVVLRNLDELRIVAADLFNQYIPYGSPGMLCIAPGTIAFNGQNTQSGGAPTVVDDIPLILTREMDPSIAALAHARMYISAVLFRHYSTVSLPPWIEAGCIEYLVDSMFPTAGIDARRRPRGLGCIRGSSELNWLLDMGADDPRMGADGEARDLSFILVSRLFKGNPDAFRRLVRLLKQGKSLNEAWKITYGITPQEHLLDAQEWFRFND